MKTCYLQFTKIYKQKELTGKKRKEQSFVGAPKNSCSKNFLHIKQKNIMLVFSIKKCCRQSGYIGDSHPELFIRKDVLKIGSKFTGEHSCQSAISIKLLCNFIEIKLRHGCSPVNLLHITRTPFLKNTSGRLLPLHLSKAVS